MNKAHIKVEKSRCGVTPLDTCWSDDGHVYAIFAGQKNAQLIGTLSDVTLTGKRNLSVRRADPYYVPVDVAQPDSVSDV